ncbi:MAG: HdeD family acid-resistance protein [Candidatus Eremiobacteraeota bacterium]|nr:HdeD family acid-resistance protein [Candidatus Eremiobacteraeota bacterium]
MHVLTQNWWMWLIRGIAAIIFGILAFIWPGPTIVVIGVLFGAYALVDGIFAIYATVRAAQTQQRWWPFLIEGIVGILIAAITFYDIRITLLALYLTIAAWAFLTGIFEIVAAIQLRKHIANEIWLIIGGIASIAFGALMIYYPLAGALALIWLIASYAILFGVLMIGFALRLRAHAQTPAAPATV